MDARFEQQIQSIHQSPVKMVLASTGGGASAVGDLLTLPGGSHTVLEAVVPYHARAMQEFLGGACDKYCSDPTARTMAMASFLRARHLAGDDSADRVAGVSVTAALVTNRPKRGEHRIHAAWQTLEATGTLSLTMTKDARTREEEEYLAAGMMLMAAAKAAGLEPTLELPTQDGETIKEQTTHAPKPWQELLVGE